MAPHGEVWVFAEIEDGRIAEVSLELLGKGRELADALGVRLGAMLLGKDVRPLAGALHARGADVVAAPAAPAATARRRCSASRPARRTSTTARPRRWRSCSRRRPAAATASERSSTPPIAPR